jgi:hypothetical protein
MKTVKIQQIPVETGAGFARWVLELSDGFEYEIVRKTDLSNRPRWSAERIDWVEDESTGDGEWVGVPVSMDSIRDMMPKLYE